MPSLIFHDQFTEASDTLLTSHTPTDVGTSWTELHADHDIYALASTDTAKRDSGGSVSGKKAVYHAVPAPDQADQYIEFTVPELDTGDDTHGGLIRSADINNCYGVYLATNRLRIYKRVSGTSTLLINDDADAPSAGDTIKFEVEGSTLTVDINATEKTSTTDTDITAAGNCGIFYGEHFVNGDDLTNDCSIDNFKVYEADGPVEKTANDSGSGTDTLLKSLTPSDSGSGSDTVTPVDRTAEETASGDGETAQVDGDTVVSFESGTGVDTLAITQDAIGNDSGSGSETTSGERATTASDSVTGTDEAQVPGSTDDSGTGVDSCSLTVDVQAYDSNSVPGTLETPIKEPVVSDLGVGTDAASGGTDNIANETMVGVDQTFIEATLSASDSGTGDGETTSTDQDHTANDTGVGVDTGIGSNEISVIDDSGSGNDTLSKSEHIRIRCLLNLQGAQNLRVGLRRSPVADLVGASEQEDSFKRDC